jgi:hypothetical protein
MSDASSKPFDPPFPGFAGFGPMMEQMESFKRLWSSMDVSSRLVPTLDIGELDKRIADLKAVEQWLNLNIGMLRGSIQGLEIQRGTLAAVQAFGSSFAVPGARANPASAPKASTPEPREPSEPPAPEGSARRPASEASSVAASASPLPAGIDPSAWWNLLQSNFQQIAQAALASAPVPVASPSSSGPAAQTSTRASTRSSARKAPTRKASTKPPARKAPGSR